MQRCIFTKIAVRRYDPDQWASLAIRLSAKLAMRPEPAPAGETGMLSGCSPREKGCAGENSRRRLPMSDAGRRRAKQIYFFGSIFTTVN
jgi:hypothetical protein